MAGGDVLSTREGKARLPLLSVEDMSPEQRAVYEKVVGGRRGKMIGPLRAALHSPDLAPLWAKFGEFLRYNTVLPDQASELAILTCGRRWSSHVEWWAHANAALDAGLSPTIIDAIAACQPPIFDEQSLLDVYEFARVLQQQGRVPLSLHDQIKVRWGARGVVELTALIGYYNLVAMTLNAHEIPLPDDVEPVFEDGEGLIDLPAGKLVE